MTDAMWKGDSFRCQFVSVQQNNGGAVEGWKGVKDFSGRNEIPY